MAALLVNRFGLRASGQPTARLLSDLADQLDKIGMQVRAVTAERVASGADTIFIYPRFVALFVMLWRGVRQPRAQVIVCLSDPPLVLMVGRLLGFWHRAPVIYWCQDVYPDVLAGLAWPRVMAPLMPLILGVVRWCHGVLMAGCAARVVPGQCLAKRLEQHCPATAKTPVLVLPNWPEPGLTPQPMPNTADTDHGAPLTVLYSGHYGHGHDLTDLISLAEHVGDQAEQTLHITIALSPRGLARWQSRHGNQPLPSSITVRPMVAGYALADHLAAAHIHVVSIKDAVSGAIMPSKAMASLCIGRPILLLGGAGSSLDTALTSHDFGLRVPSGDVTTARAWLEGLAADRARLEQLGRQAQDYGQRLAAQHSLTRLSSLVSHMAGDPVLTPDPAHKKNQQKTMVEWEQHNA
ncbi:MAG: hypothetical protein AAF213_01755 [Pseudomonadota bacterium]